MKMITKELDSITIEFNPLDLEGVWVLARLGDYAMGIMHNALPVVMKEGVDETAFNRSVEDFGTLAAAFKDKGRDGINMTFNRLEACREALAEISPREPEEPTDETGGENE